MHCDSVRRNLLSLVATPLFDITHEAGSSPGHTGGTSSATSENVYLSPEKKMKDIDMCSDTVSEMSDNSRSASSRVLSFEFVKS